MLCPKCGASIPESYKFCANCGTSVEPVIPDPELNPVSVENSAQNIDGAETTSQIDPTQDPQSVQQTIPVNQKKVIEIKKNFYKGAIIGYLIPIVAMVAMIPFVVQFIVSESVIFKFMIVIFGSMLAQLIAIFFVKKKFLLLEGHGEIVCNYRTDLQYSELNFVIWSCIWLCTVEFTLLITICSVIAMFYC